MIPFGVYFNGIELKAKTLNLWIVGSIPTRVTEQKSLRNKRFEGSFYFQIFKL